MSEKGVKTFYITTSIAYANASPHIGYALELIQGDVLARYHRFLSEDVFFLTGTDEHGSKIAQKAREAGKTPEKFTDEISEEFKRLTKVLNISNDDFIRTSDKKIHWPIVENIWQQLKDNGDIVEKKYKGLYCVGCEDFLKEKDLVDGKCPNHQKEPEVVQENNYFFKLSKYQNEIKKAIKSEQIKIFPEVRKNEILSFIEQGLEDVSFSRDRSKLSWGIPVPGDDSQTIYVWADALLNYFSGIDYPNEKFKKYWPANVHIVGKDIQRFHTIIWTGMLLALKLPLPENILIHGHITVAGQKMSKSLGNVVDPFELVKKYGTDSVRYFLLREIPSMEDGDFTYEKFETRYNADLASGLGNLVARVITLADKNNINISGRLEDKTFRKEAIDRANIGLQKNIEWFKFNEALASIWESIVICNKYIDREKPWQESENSKEVIRKLLFVIEEIAMMIKPFLPETSEKILKQLKSRKSEPLFPRI